MPVGWWLWLWGCRADVVEFVPGAIPGTGEIRFTPPKDGEAWVEHGTEGALDTRSPTIPASDGVIPLLGLKTGKATEFQVVFSRKGKEKRSDIIEATVPAPPQSASIPPFTVETSDPSRMCDPGGYILFSYLTQGASGLAIIDRDASYVWVLPQTDPTLQVGRAHAGRDGKTILWSDADDARCRDVATITRTSMDGTERTVTRTKQGHHDFLELPDGRFAWLGYDIRPPPDGLVVDGLVAADTIYEGEEGITSVDEAELVFDAWEDYPPGVYTVPDEDRFLCPIDGDVPEWGDVALEFGHGNSLAYRESDDAYFTMWRWLDVLIKVDRGGGYAWEMGGAFGNLPGDPATLFEHGHFSDLWDGGMLVFDNQTRQEKSRLVRYSFDDQGYEQTWEYASEEYEAILGDVRRIPVEGCDNLLVAWSGQGRISEIDPETGDIVWDAPSDIRYAVGRLTWLPDLYDFTGAAYPP